MILLLYVSYFHLSEPISRDRQYIILHYLAVIFLFSRFNIEGSSIYHFTVLAIIVIFNNLISRYLRHSILVSTRYKFYLSIKQVALLQEWTKAKVIRLPKLGSAYYQRPERFEILSILPKEDIPLNNVIPSEEVLVTSIKSQRSSSRTRHKYPQPALP